MTNINNLLENLNDRKKECVQVYSNVKTYLQKLKSSEHLHKKMMYVSLGALTGLIIGTMIYYGINMEKNIAIINSYKTALIQYADKNDDGNISQEEESAFNKDLFRDKNVILVNNHNGEFKMQCINGKFEIQYRNGELVSRDSLKTWIETYEPTE